jgi:hypothetical protein
MYAMASQRMKVAGISSGVLPLATRSTIAVIAT